MTKSELIQAVSERQSIPKKRAEEIVNAMFAAMADALIDNRRIEVRGFGSFSIREYEARLGRNPRTNETVHVDAKRSVHFKVGKELRDLVSEASIELQP
ncbi:MAG: HU family DNA-binding protein [Myxococcota bacterium]